VSKGQFLVEKIIQASTVDAQSTIQEGRGSFGSIHAVPSKEKEGLLLRAALLGACRNSPTNPYHKLPQNKAIKAQCNCTISRGTPQGPLWKHCSKRDVLAEGGAQLVDQDAHVEGGPATSWPILIRARGTREAQGLQVEGGDLCFWRSFAVQRFCKTSSFRRAPA